MMPGSGNFLVDLQDNAPTLKWDCRLCGKELDGNDPEGDLCLQCKQKQEG